LSKRGRDTYLATTAASAQLGRTSRAASCSAQQQAHARTCMGCRQGRAQKRRQGAGAGMWDSLAVRHLGQN